MRTKPLPIITGKVEERFWSAITVGEPDDCWLWNKKCLSNDGYGTLVIGSKLYLSHRLAAQIAGLYLPVGKRVCSTCSVRACCYSSPLFIGKSADILEMRKRAASGESYVSLGRHFNVPAETIVRIVLSAGSRLD